MRNNSQDDTIKRNYIQKYRFLIKEYELVKMKGHPKFKLVQDFYKATDTDRRSFLKYYNRYKQSGRELDLLPQKRGPKWKTRRPVSWGTLTPTTFQNVSFGTRVKSVILCWFLIRVPDRVAWAEIVEDITSLTVMFAALKCLNILADHYDIRFKEVLTDNGPEVGTKRSKKKARHPFERMLMELEIKHRYTRPYRPQTNGKAERFWRTIEDDLLRETTFESLDELKEELLQYLYYYNHERPHQGIGGMTPVEFNKTCPRIT